MQAKGAFKKKLGNLSRLFTEAQSPQWLKGRTLDKRSKPLRRMEAIVRKRLSRQHAKYQHAFAGPEGRIWTLDKRS